MAEGTSTKEAVQEKAIEKKSGGKKFWSGFLHFLMYGGWILIVIVILAIVIAISLVGAPPKPIP